MRASEMYEIIERTHMKHPAYRHTCRDISGIPISELRDSAASGQESGAPDSRCDAELSLNYSALRMPRHNIARERWLSLRFRGLLKDKNCIAIRNGGILACTTACDAFRPVKI
jgi:hypothetical protein